MKVMNLQRAEFKNTTKIKMRRQAMILKFHCSYTVVWMAPTSLHMHA